MAIGIEKLQQLLNKEGIKHFLAPDRPLCLVLVAGQNGVYQLAVSAQDDGEFLQFRTLGYLMIDRDNPNLSVTLRVLSALNSELRVVKFAWYDDDGEIMAYADHMVMDNDVTQVQFRRILRMLLGAIDRNCPRIKSALETGVDPGDIAPPMPITEGPERI